VRERASGHDFDEFVVDAGLVLLVQTFGFVEIGENVGLALWEVAADAFADVRRESDDEGERLAGEGEMFGCDVLEAGDAGGACAEDELG
jgi:hypothetical protein